MTTWRSPSRGKPRRGDSGSSRRTASGRPRSTAQKPQGRVHTSPRIMNVAVRRVQHSERFGQLGTLADGFQAQLADQAAREGHPARRGDRPLEPLRQSPAAAATAGR